MQERVYWTAADIELLPDNGNRYEIIDGELFVTGAPHWRHQRVCGSVFAALETWSKATGSGQAAFAPGVLFGNADNVIPDVVWVSNERLALLLDTAGHLTGAPELVVEVLSTGAENERRDRETKLKLYSVHGVHEYWIFDWSLTRVEVYRREQAVLKAVATLGNLDFLATPLLPGFSCAVEALFQ